MATVPTTGTTFELVATAALAVASVTLSPSVSPGALSLSATASLAVSRVSIFPAIGTLELSASATLKVSKVNVTHPGAALIGAAIEDILHLFGCCNTTNECILNDAVMAVNTGLQQFYLSDRVKGVATNPQRQVYEMNGPSDSDIDGSGAMLPDINVSQAAQNYGVSNAYSVLSILKVTYSAGIGTFILRPSPISPGSMNKISLDDSDPSEGSLVMWHEDSSSTDDVPYFYEVFQYSGMPAIKVFPPANTSASEYVTVHYIPRPEPVTAADLTNGAAFDVQAAFVESWIMPLCRYAALSTSSFDHANTSLVESIKARYTETLSILGLADIQQPRTAAA